MQDDAQPTTGAGQILPGMMGRYARTVIGNLLAADNRSLMRLYQSCRLRGNGSDIGLNVRLFVHEQQDDGDRRHNMTQHADARIFEGAQTLRK